MTKRQKIKYKTSWQKTMLAKYGSEEAVRQEMHRRYEMSRKNYKGTGGFKALQQSDPDKLRAISSKGGSHAKKTGRSPT